MAFFDLTSRIILETIEEAGRLPPGGLDMRRIREFRDLAVARVQQAGGSDADVQRTKDWVDLFLLRKIGAIPASFSLAEAAFELNLRTAKGPLPFITLGIAVFAAFKLFGFLASRK